MSASVIPWYEREEFKTRNRVKRALDEVKAPGSTAVSGSSSLPAPGLCVEGVGVIPLPANEAVVTKLKEVAQQAPHGQGMKTIIDVSVRNTLQVEPANITLQNPAWETALQQLTVEIALQLGVDPKCVRTELYKLLIYEPGSFFQKHRDTEKAQGMFGTLVIQLPSKFTGGRFVVSHGDETRAFRQDTPDSSYACRYVAHYADCEHEIEKIESGYRLALVYSLCYTGTDSSPTASTVESTSELSEALHSMPPTHTIFLVSLQHKYTDSSLGHLGCTALKGADRAKQLAISACDDWKVVILQAEKNCREWGDSVDSDGDFVVKESDHDGYTIVSAYHEDGSKASSETIKWLQKQVCDFDHSVGEGGLTMGGIHRWRVKGELDRRPGWTGNEGADRDTTYNTYAMVAFSEQCTLERICSSRDFDGAAAAVVRDGSPEFLARFVTCLDQQCYSCLSYKAFLSLMPCIDAGEPNADELQKRLRPLLSKLEHGGRDCFPSSEFSDALVALINRHGWSVVGEPIQELFSDWTQRALNITEKWKKPSLFQFIMNAGLILSIQEASSEQEFFGDILQKWCEELEWQAYDCKKGSSELTSLIQWHGWERAATVVQSCVIGCRERGSNGLESIAGRVGMLQVLSSLPDRELHKAWCRDAVEDFMVYFMDPKSKEDAILKMQTSYYFEQWDSPQKLLFEIGSDEDFERMKTWANTIEPKALVALEKSAVRTSSNSKPNDLVERRASHVESFCKTIRLNKLRARHEELVVATKGGEPKFSWSMPEASTSNEALKRFLQSSNEGPVGIAVGTDPKTASSMANFGRGSWIGRNHNWLEKGYSAKIEGRYKRPETEGTNGKSFIRVTKTRDFHYALVAKYRDNMRELPQLEAEIKEAMSSS